MYSSGAWLAGHTLATASRPCSADRRRSVRCSAARISTYWSRARLVDQMLEALPPAVSSGARYWLMPAAKRTLARLNG